MNKTFTQCISNINEKISSTSNKFKNLCNSYYNGVNNINKLNKDKKEIQENIKVNSNKILEILNSENSTSELKDVSNIYRKRLNNSNLKIGDLINFSFKVSGDSINSLFEIIQDKDKEIKHLNDRINSYCQEIEIIKKSNESQAKDKSKAAQIQQTQLENQLKSKEEEITKIQKVLNKNIEEMNKTKKEIEIKKKNEEEKATQKYASTGKFFILQYYHELSKFSNELCRYCDENKKDKK